MPIIKRYPNRKLYDTDAKQYVTLNRIAELIRQGEEVQVIDHATGQDLTALTLTQIIFEQEKKQKGLLPNSILTGLIRTSGDRLTSIQRSLFSSTFWQQIDEEIKRRIQALTKLGELTEEEGKRILDKLLHPDIRTREVHSSRDKVSRISDQELEEFLRSRQIPTKIDLQHLSDQIEELTSKLEEIG